MGLKNYVADNWKILQGCLGVINDYILAEANKLSRRHIQVTYRTYFAFLQFSVVLLDIKEAQRRTVALSGRFVGSTSLSEIRDTPFCSGRFIAIHFRLLSL
jgi:hypothetical protein